MTRNTLCVLGVLSLLAGVSQAATIAIIDSGVDYKHQALAAQMWTNPASETTDKDGKKYSQDTHGWNFAENNNQIIDYKYLNTFSEDCTKIFLVQSKILQDQATAEEKSWYDAKKKDAEFLKELGKFGNFVHGTHVSGMSSHEAIASKIVALKLIATEPPGGREELIAEAQSRFGTNDAATNPLAKMFLQMLASRQAALLITVGKYVEATKSQIANGSFGTSVKAVQPVVANLLKSLLGKEPTEEEGRDYSIYFVQQIVEASKEFVGTSPDTLFVFAAGNDGTNNDELPTSPANIKADNSMAVAATVGISKMATFTNYGAAMVDIAAPGVAMLSSIPGDKYLPMSGTSMAAPFVTNVAGLVKDANPMLKPVEIKQILMGTVDVKPFLSGKVKAGGIVNLQRAVHAAQLTAKGTLTAAIEQAKKDIPDVAPTAIDLRNSDDRGIFVLPLPSPFQ